jgi:hypothetical protein
MFFSGLVIWDQYFYQYTVIETKRWALLAHSLAAVIAIAMGRGRCASAPSGAATCGGGGRPSRP